MALSRRKMIALIGGGVVLAASGSAAGFLTTRRPDSALAPWEAAGGYSDPRLNALSYALLAPNPHNRQPWEAELVGDTGLIIHRDRSRNLPATDPFDRQLTIGMGCFLELLRMAAAAQGYALDQTLFPDGEDGPVARITFAKGGQADPLFAHALNRRTNRSKYEDRLPDAQAIAALSEIGQVVLETGQVDATRQLTQDAMRIEMLTHEAMMESVDLMRIGKAEINANPDGISMGGPFLESLSLVGILSREALADPNSAGFKQGLEITLGDLSATHAYAVITTPGNSRLDQIEAGRRWIRLNLTATGHGLAMQPVSQALQEYPEMAEPYDRVHKMFAGPGETVQMLGRLGYAPQVDASPRWPLETRLLNA